MSGSKASWAALVYAAIATGTMVLNAAAPSAASQPPPPVIRHYPPHPAAFLLCFVRDTASLTEGSKADLSRALRDQV